MTAERTPFVIQVTATRHARGAMHGAIIRGALRHVTAGLPVWRPILVRHGAARGGDHMVGVVALSMGWRVDPMPADWETCQPDCNPKHRKRNGNSTYCPRAGIARNRAMVDKDPIPDVVLGFPLASSDSARSGTWHCLHYAVSRGYRCLVYPLALLPQDEPHGMIGV